MFVYALGGNKHVGHLHDRPIKLLWVREDWRGRLKYQRGFIVGVGKQNHALLLFVSSSHVDMIGFNYYAAER